MIDIWFLSTYWHHIHAGLSARLLHCRKILQIIYVDHVTIRLIEDTFHSFWYKCHCEPVARYVIRDGNPECEPDFVTSRVGEDHRSLILIFKIFAIDLDLLCDLDSWRWSLILDLDLAQFDLDIKITNIPNLNVGIFQYLMHHTLHTFKRNYPNPNYTSSNLIKKSFWKTPFKMDQIDNLHEEPPCILKRII